MQKVCHAIGKSASEVQRRIAIRLVRIRSGPTGLALVPEQMHIAEVGLCRERNRPQVVVAVCRRTTGESIDLARKHHSAAKDMLSASGTKIVRDMGLSRFTMQKQLSTEHIPHSNERSGN